MNLRVFSSYAETFFHLFCVFISRSSIFDYLCTEQNKRTAMKTATKKTKVIEKLIKWGNSPKDVEAMVAEHFEYAAGTYSSVTSIAECLRTIY